jgi:thymidylate kinase
MSVDLQKSRPPFIVIEGIDRVGKNTQASLLADRLRAVGIPTGLFSTPDYETETGKVIDRFLGRNLQVVDELRGPQSRADEVALNCLMIANRYEVSSRIQRSLRSGECAVCVRWYPSSLLYNLQDDRVWVEKSVQDLPEPDLFILLDADMDVVSKRLDPSKRYEGVVEFQALMAVRYRFFWRSRFSSSWKIVGPDADHASEGVWRAVCEARPDIAGRVE